MSRLAELIKELCPDGVEYRPLSELVRIRNGCDYKALSSGNVPVYGSGGVMTHVSEALGEGPTVLIPRKGSLDNIFFVEGEFWTVDTIFYTEIASELDPKFFFYKMKTMQLSQMNEAAGVPSMNQKKLGRILIPVPPLEVQREIVRILDQFTTLEAELEARRTQYEYYRSGLLSYESLAARGPVEMVKLGDISHISAGYGFPKSEQGRLSGEYPFYKVSDMNRPRNRVFLEEAANYLAESDLRRLKITPFPVGSIVFPKIGAAIATNKKRILSVPSLVDNNVAVCIPEGIDAKYLYYWFLEQDLLTVAHDSGAVPSIRKADLEQLDVPMPTVEEQTRIVAILDRFDALVNDISSGLPAEIDARRTQYEYYRERLLSFPEKQAD